MTAQSAMERLFLDANVLFSAGNSPHGAVRELWATMDAAPFPLHLANDWHSRDR